MREWLEKYINDNPDFIQPESRKNEMVNNFIKPGLEDLCVSRSSFKWGIPVSFDTNHVIYVWIDALSNYITFLGYEVDGTKKEEFTKYWPCDIHLIGKDILRFHTIYWPIMLHALGIELPHKIFGHPWLLSGDDKMSKSKGNIVYADLLVNKYGVDPIRFYMLKEIPFGSDGTYTEKLLIESINSNLANNLGNLVNRTVGMINKYFNGSVTNKNINETVDEELIRECLNLKSKVDEKIDNVRISDSLELIFDLFKKCNKYIDDTTPWVLAKEEDKMDRLMTVLYNLIESIRFGTVLLQAYLPETADDIFNIINTNYKSFDTLDKFGYYDSEKVGESKVLFQRIEEE